MEPADFQGYQSLCCLECCRAHMGVQPLAHSSSWPLTSAVWTVFRGELPGQEYMEPADFQGYQSLRCLNVVVRTGVSQSPGILDARVAVTGADASGSVDLAAACGFPLLPRLTVTWPSALPLTACCFAP